MLQTIYKTARPQDIANTGTAEDLTDAEYRQVLMKQVGDHPLDSYIVKVNQGWWDDGNKKEINPTTIFEAHYKTWIDAQASYDEQVLHLVAEGYIHSFTPPPLADENSRDGYKKLTANK